MTLPATTKSQRRLFLYIGANSVSLAAAGLHLAMFGDGTLTWAQFRFAWVMFALGLAGSTFTAVRAFIDQSHGADTPADPAK